MTRMQNLKPEFPPRQKPGSFSVDQAMEQLLEQAGN